ncbi:MAG: hypothetical protein AB7P03_00055 [Kofleriaceae bacterium]
MRRLPAFESCDLSTVQGGLRPATPSTEELEKSERLVNEVTAKAVVGMKWVGDKLAKGKSGPGGVTGMAPGVMTSILQTRERSGAGEA